MLLFSVEVLSFMPVISLLRRIKKFKEVFKTSNIFGDDPWSLLQGAEEKIISSLCHLILCTTVSPLRPFCMLLMKCSMVGKPLEQSIYHTTSVNWDIYTLKFLLMLIQLTFVFKIMASREYVVVKATTFKGIILKRV